MHVWNDYQNNKQFTQNNISLKNNIQSTRIPLKNNIQSTRNNLVLFFTFISPLILNHRTAVVIFRSQAKPRHQTTMSSLKAALAKLMKQGIHRLIEESRKPCA